MKIKLEKGAWRPTRAHDTDAGLDLYAYHDALIPALGGALIRTGVHIELPPMTAGLLVSKSGLNTKYGITTTGLIDEGYTGEILVKAYNHSDYDYHVQAGDKISQLVVFPVEYADVEIVDELCEKTARGENGFGSSGR